MVWGADAETNECGGGRPQTICLTQALGFDTRSNPIHLEPHQLSLPAPNGGAEHRNFKPKSNLMDP
jgi:hypothetical protein